MNLKVLLVEHSIQLSTRSPTRDGFHLWQMFLHHHHCRHQRLISMTITSHEQAHVVRQTRVAVQTRVGLAAFIVIHDLDDDDDIWPRWWHLTRYVFNRPIISSYLNRKVMLRSRSVFMNWSQHGTEIWITWISRIQTSSWQGSRFPAACSVELLSSGWIEKDECQLPDRVISLPIFSTETNMGSSQFMFTGSNYQWRCQP